SQTTLGKEAKGYLDAGRLVPDSVIIGLVEEELGRLNGKSFILDGFPRNVAQAEALEKLLQQTSLKVDRVLFMEVPLSMLLGRLTGRRVCRSCGAVYHMDSKPPKKSGVCDNCGGEVYQRADDKEEVIRTRLEAYESSTKPLKDYYKAKGPFVEIDGTGSSEDVFGRVSQVLQVKR
ncbi:MAG TPA: nucleoside monophosphate kinase, partial [Bdellovibrionales bacterium]|nr:nucleoside monophosphate kinase [Bdellovibrionales bacterium]